MEITFYLFALTIIIMVGSSEGVENPIIGVLAQESYLVRNAYPDSHSFIAASYVKLLESSGARVVPVWIGKDESYYREIVNYTNGFLFPGGGTYFNETGGYAEAALKIYKHAMTANKNNIYYPILGICLGMQVMVFSFLDGVDIRKKCSSKNQALPLDFRKDYEKSRLFSQASPELLSKLQTESLTFNYHQFCLLEEDLRKNGALEEWTILATNKDVNNKEFVAAFENLKYPFYGIQFHPEKNLFEFKNKNVPHGKDSVEVAQYFGNFFVQQSRLNDNKYPNLSKEREAFIYNFNPVYSLYNTSYEQLYVFNE